ncbi:alkaline phosphatase family protein [Haladaptatus caseinilyticus]|uniref:alkaline phosphatase family protein n=1 Tax=Haladaptatus caseinilyticus TaxID=2993314 RepID=UPI00224B5C7D|nr:alkaline phosphatase family protein [Haladaptatus caseinilyticus]
MSMETSNPVRAFVLGFDGVPWGLIRRWTEEGQLPNFARLIEEGASGPLSSTTPDATPLAWPTIATGVWPDKHGLYDFQHLESSYSHRMNTSADVRRPELWDIISPSAVGNVPMTYPASEIDGTLVTGMMTPEMDKRFTHPTEFGAELKKTIPDYKIGLSWDEFRDRPDEFLEELSTLLDNRRKLMRRLMEEQWRLFFFVYTAPDRLQHLIWEDDILLDHYRELDDILGEVMEYTESRDAALFVVSDHGFGPISQFVFLNTLLEREGLLHRKGGDGTRGALARLGLTKDRVQGLLSRMGVSEKLLVEHLPRSVVDSVAAQVPGEHNLYDVDFEETVAFAHGSGNVYINDTIRFDPGVVTPEDVPAIKEDLRSMFEGLTDPQTEDRVLKVHDGDELFPTDPRSPDLVVKGRDEYETAVSLTRDVFRDSGSKVASHRPEGIFFAWGPSIEQGTTTTDANVTDIAPTVLHSLDEAVPSDADGRVLKEIFHSGSKPGHRAVSQREYGESGTPAAVEANFDDVEDRLRGLGYME